MISLWYLGLAGIMLTPRIPIHYSPPDVDIGNLDKIFSTLLRIKGVYNSSFVCDKDYGIYNYCNMPHVRSSEYVVPSSEYILKYVEVIHRHHKRTPYQTNTFPQEDILLSCSSTENIYFGQVNDRPKENVEIGWLNYQDPINPFMYKNPGFNGTCQFPQISDGGFNDSYHHGIDLFHNYFTNLHFLPETYNSSLVQFYVTSNVITSQVAGALIAGMYPPRTNAENVFVNVQRSASDSLEPKYQCTGADNTKKDIYRETEWLTHLNLSLDLFNELDEISGVDSSDEEWHISWDHYFDNLSHRLCHGLPLPCHIEGKFCMSESQAFQVFRLGDYEYHYLYRKSQRSTLYSTARYGVFLMQLIHHFEQAIKEESQVLYRHNIAHDGSISPLLGALQIDMLRWPGMGAEVVFELWEKQTEFFVRVLYGGQPMATSGLLGVLDMVPYEDFTGYLNSLVGDNNVIALCDL